MASKLPRGKGGGKHVACLEPDPHHSGLLQRKQTFLGQRNTATATATATATMTIQPRRALAGGDDDDGDDGDDGDDNDDGF